MKLPVAIMPAERPVARPGLPRQCWRRRLAPLLVLALHFSGLAQNSNPVSPTSFSLAVDKQPAQSCARWRAGFPAEDLAPGSHRLQISFQPVRDDGKNSLRLRYQMQGLEPGWQEAGGEMRISLLFYAANEEIVGNFSFVVHGNSSGWNSTVENSTFSAHHERVPVPPGAKFIQFKITSGGPPESVGLIALRDLKVFAAPSAEAARTNLWPYTKLTFTTNSDAISDVPAGWLRGGFPSRLAQVLHAPGMGRALAIVDDSRTGYAEWVSELVGFAGESHLGETLDLDWQELFTVGLAAGSTVDFSYVPPGSYTFQVKAVSPLGADLGGSSRLLITIPDFWWERPWFIILALALAAGALAFWVRYVTRRRLQLRVERLEHQRGVQRERERIARDIHDDLGANLAQIAMLSELAQADLGQPEKARERLNKIFNTSRQLTRQLDETVWAINPAHDSLEDIVAFLGNFAQEHFRLAGIRCRLDLPEELPDISLSSAVRHNVFLAAKEALQNVAKHSGATEVWLRLQARAGDLIFTIEDNGKGFAPGAGQAGGGGNGVNNMQKRLVEIGGRFELNHQPGQGVTVRLVLPGVLKPAAAQAGAAGKIGD